MASTKRIHSEERGCWIQKSNACTKAKIGTTIGITALTAIAVVAGLFLVLAQHGVHLGGLNSMAQMMDARWLYVGMSIASAALIVDVTFLIVCLRNARKETLSKNEQRGTATQNSIEQNSKDAIKGAKADDEFNVETGEAMLACSWSKKNLVLKELGLFVKEYITLEVTIEALQQNSYHEAIFPLLSRNESGEVAYRYFKTAQARKSFKKSLVEQGYASGTARQIQAERFVKLRVTERLEAAAAKNTINCPKEVPYCVFEHPNQKKAHVVFVTSYLRPMEKKDQPKNNALIDFDRCTVRHMYFNLEDVHTKINQVQTRSRDSYVDINTFNLQLGPNEEKYVCSQVSKDLLSLEEKTFEKKTFEKKTSLDKRYTAIFVRHKDENGQFVRKERAFLTSDPELQNFLTKLKKDGYTQK